MQIDERIHQVNERSKRTCVLEPESRLYLFHSNIVLGAVSFYCDVMVQHIEPFQQLVGY
jgi:hypothetical protein